MPDRPNILLITSDQHRSECLGCAGHPSIQTPHLDQLAFEGIRFTNAYSDCPICIPGRTTLITGIQSHIYGMPSYAEKYRIERPREKFLGSLVTAAGYQTELLGKKHWHTDPSFRAGFELAGGLRGLKREQLRYSGQAHGTTGVGANECFATRSHYPPHLYRTNWLTDEAIDFVNQRDKTQPFFLWVSYQDPHPPIVIHEPFYSMYDNDIIPNPVMPEWALPEKCPRAVHEHRTMYNSCPMTLNAVRKARSTYYGVITNLDFQLGRLFGAMMQQGVWEDTLVLYTTDHGEHLGDYGDLAKSSFFEVSGNLPFIVRPPKAMRDELKLESGPATTTCLAAAMRRSRPGTRWAGGAPPDPSRSVRSVGSDRSVGSLPLDTFRIEQHLQIAEPVLDIGGRALDTQLDDRPAVLEVHRQTGEGQFRTGSDEHLHYMHKVRLTRSRQKQLGRHAFLALFVPVLEHPLHHGLGHLREPGQEMPVPHPEPRYPVHSVGYQHGAPREIDHAQPLFRAPVPEPVPENRLPLRVPFDRHPGHPGGALARAVVGRRPDPAAAEERLRPCHGPGQLCVNDFGHIRQDHTVGQGDGALPQDAHRRLEMGVLPPAVKNLVADDYQPECGALFTVGHAISLPE